MKTGWLAAAGLLVLGLPLEAQEIDFGAVEVMSEPGDAAVYIEGFLVGRTPVTAQRLTPEATYRVVIQREAHDGVVRDVRVTAGEIAKVAAGLVADSGGWRSAVRAEDDWTPVLEKQRKQFKKARSRRSLRSYAALELANFLMKSDITVVPSHRYALLGHVARELDERTRFRRFVSSYTAGPSGQWAEAGGNEPTVVLSGVITYYRPGSRARRMLIGWGQGDTKIHCVLRVADKETGEVLLERMEEGYASGISSSSTAIRRLANRIAKAVASNW